MVENNRYLVTAFDESFSLMGAALINSIWENSIQEYPISIVVLDLGIDTVTKSKYSVWANLNNRKLEFICVFPSMFLELIGVELNKIEDFRYYIKPLIPHLLRGKTDKIIYVDADVICLKPLHNLFEFDFGDYIICASPDFHFRKFSDQIVWPHQRSVIENYYDFKVDKHSPYFNAGVFIIDINKWLRNNISSRILEITNTYPEFVVLWDQYSLNIALHGKWFAMADDFNSINKANLNTIFRHYAGHKPTSFDYPNSDKRLFYKYLRTTFYKNWRPINPYSFIYRISKRIKKYYKSLKTRIHTIIIKDLLRI